jgi:hypothetical protein
MEKNFCDYNVCVKKVFIYLFILFINFIYLFFNYDVSSSNHAASNGKIIILSMDATHN